MEHVHGILLDQKILCRSVHAVFVNTKCTRCGWSAPSFRTRSSTICGAQWAPDEACNSHHAKHKTHSHLFFHVCVVVLSFVASRSVAAAAASSLKRFSGETFVCNQQFTTHFGCVLEIVCAFSAKSRHCLCFFRKISPLLVFSEKSRHCLCTLQRSRHHIHDEDRRQQQLFQWLVVHDCTASCVRSRSKHIFSAFGTTRADGARQIRLVCAKPQTTSEDLGMKAVLLAAKCTYRNSATLKHTRTQIPALPHTCIHSMTSFFLRWMRRKISNRQNQRLHQCTSIRGPLTEPNQRTGHLCASCEAGCHHQSAPRAPGNSSIVDGHGTSQNRAPPQMPSLLGTFPQQICLASCLCPGQLKNKLLRFLQPPTPDFDAQHDHLRLWPTNSKNMRPIRRCASNNATPSIGSTLRFCAVGTNGAHEGGIRCQLCATEEGQAIHHPSSLRHPPLTSVMTRPQASRQTLATAFSETHHRRAKTPARARQECAVKKRGRPSRRRRTTRNNWGGIFVSLLVGHLNNANPTPDAPWDLAKAILTASTRVKTSLSLKCHSTREAALYCQPSLQHPGSKFSGSRDAGLTPSARACHVGGSKSHTPVNSFAAEAAASNRGVPSTSSTIN